MLVSTVMSFERTPYTRFSVPIQPWGSIVLVPQPPVDEPSLTNRLFTWVTPFTGSVWVVLTGASVLIGMFMSLCAPLPPQPLPAIPAAFRRPCVPAHSPQQQPPQGAACECDPLGTPPQHRRFEIGRGTEDYNHIDSDSAFATKLMQYG